MKNWKTTLLGLIGAVAQVVIPLIQTGTLTWKEIGFAALTAAFGYFAKDFDQTGTTK